MRHIYLVEKGERDWVSAASEKEAIGYLANLHGYASADEYREDENPIVTPLLDSELLKVYQDTPFRDPTPSVTKTCRQWADEREGIVASTSY